MATIVSIPVLKSINANSASRVTKYYNDVAMTKHIMTHQIADVLETKVMVDDVLTEKVMIIYKRYSSPNSVGDNYQITEVVTNLSISEVIGLINS